MSARHTAFGQAVRGNAYAAHVAAWRSRWLLASRPEQLPPRRNQPWGTWLNICGRGWGKTRTGAEDTGYFAATHRDVRCAVVAPTRNDCMTVCFEGVSGLLRVIPKPLIADYNRSNLELRLVNGSLIVGLSAEKPDRARGPQWHRAWMDELASWPRLEDMWHNMELALRLGDNPQRIITTTPRPLQFLRDLAKDPDCVVVKRSTYENAANLSGKALERMRKTFEGTSKGRQELHGDILDEAVGALWKRALVEHNRRPMPAAKLRRIVVAVDPAVTSEASSDETGIIVCGVDDDEHVYVLLDASGRYGPVEWAKIVLNLYESFNADAIVAEVNNGGDLVEANLNAVASSSAFRYIAVRARRGKYLRAEPVAALYEKNQVHHVGVFPDLENQMVNFKGIDTEKSPDRLDALVYGVTDLILGEGTNAFW